MDDDQPAWIPALTEALGAAYGLLRLEKGDKDRGRGTHADVTEALTTARRAGWDGSDRDFWKAAETMAAFTGAMPWHPQRHFMDGELQRWRAAAR